ARKFARRELNGHTAIVTALAVSPDGATLASGAGDRTVKLWQLTEGDRTMTSYPGRLKATYRGHASPPSAVAYTAHRTTLASPHASGTVLFWVASSDPECQQPGEHAGRIGTVRYTPDGRRILAVDYTHIPLYDAADGRRLAQFPAGHWVFGTSLSPDGK